MNDTKIIFPNICSVYTAHKTASDDIKHNTANPRMDNNSRNQINDINSTVPNITKRIFLYSPKSAMLKCNTFHKNHPPPIPNVTNALFLLKIKKLYIPDNRLSEHTTHATANNIIPTTETTKDAHIIS